MTVQLGRHQVAPAVAAPFGVGNVARGLLEVRHQAPSFQDLGQDIRNVLARQMNAAELRDRVVSVVVEHLLVQPFGAGRADGRRGRRGRVRDLIGELVEEQPPQGLGRSRVAREQRAFDRFRKIDQREDRAVDVGEIRRERGGLQPERMPSLLVVLVLRPIAMVFVHERQRLERAHAIEEQHAVQMIGLVLNHSRRQPSGGELHPPALSIVRVDLDLVRSRHEPADVRNAQTAFPPLLDGLADHRQLRIDERR